MPYTRLSLSGPVPSKKNLYRRSRNGRLFLDREVKAQIDALILQAKGQWRQPPLRHPDVDVEFFVIRRNSDRDNKLGTVLDVLQEAGVIAQDNTAHFNGTVTILPAVVGNQQGVIIDLRDRGQDFLDGAIVAQASTER